MKNKLLLMIMLMLACSLSTPAAQPKEFINFPKGYTPQEVGVRLADHFVVSRHALHVGKWIGYPETFTWRGSLLFAQATGDTRLLRLLEGRFAHLFGPEKQLLPIMNHVDVNMFGSLPLLLYRITKDKKYLDLGLPYADTQWQCPNNPRVSEKGWADKGFSWQTRMWIDDMYMITIVQTEAYRATGEQKYLDRAADEMAYYLDHLQCENGLFYHAPDVPFYWGRGNGWMAAGMTEMLKLLPANHPRRARILEGYLKMMNSLRTYQNKEGLWNQLIDQPDFWTETSGSAMFTYAFINGVKYGWLDAKVYAPLARKAWIKLVDYINDNADVLNVCEGTNKKNDKQYYYDRKRYPGDYHGQAPYLWCAAALLEK